MRGPKLICPTIQVANGSGSSLGGANSYNYLFKSIEALYGLDTEVARVHPRNRGYTSDRGLTTCRDHLR
ncbi:hypothetical protein P8C59_006473 [Phyllachora maydis]|uniref:Uncharacterized protein n=1 Tax=Phyllachora maydis TaxID=1825666 RepID=A0AAD9I872_9PEZI|nr:hypothetical protein P8C59_006473 [Phyllachora maydis]